VAILTCLKHAVPVPDARDLTYISAQIFSRLICYAQSRKRTFRRPDLIGFSPAVATGSLKHVTAGLKHGRNANRVASSTPWPRSLRTPTSRFCPYHTSVIAYTDSEMREISTCFALRARRLHDNSPVKKNTLCLENVVGDARFQPRFAGLLPQNRRLKHDSHPKRRSPSLGYRKGD